jgi:hypothetical protein
MSSRTSRKAARYGIEFIRSIPAFAGMTIIISLTPSAHAEPIGSVCLQLSEIDHTEVLDDQTLLFHMKDQAVWENLLPEKCDGLKAKNGFEYAGPEPKICGDIDLIHPLNSDASCALGPFQLYRGAEDQ